MSINVIPTSPILYSFRRCPFAIRARMALAVAAESYEIREVSLRAKPGAMLNASPKATVPVLVLPDGRVIDESIDIMRWALERRDPEHWLQPGDDMLEPIARIDGPFKFHLDRMKYATRYPGSNPIEHRAAAIKQLTALEERLSAQSYLFGGMPSLADVASFPFVRQFAHADAGAFAAEPLPALQAWLARWESSALFAAVMAKLPLWESNS